MQESTRKAVITLAQVQEVFTAYLGVRSDMGQPSTGHTFDRGNRGKGFAEYSATDSTVRTFDTKEEAHTFYSRYSEIAREVMTAVGHVPAPQESEESTQEEEGHQEVPQESQESQESKSAPAQTRRRVKKEDGVSAK